MSTSNFIHIRNYTQFSLSSGALRLNDLTSFCIENNSPAIGISDKGNLFGCMEFSVECIKSGIQPIVSCNLNIIDQNYEIGDVLSDIAIYFPFIYFNSLSIELIIIFISLSVINEFCGLLAKSISGIRRYDGPMGKSDRAFFVGIICIILYFTNAILVYLDYIFLFAIILMIISSFLRLTKSLKNE